jgi:hypothetical protein
VQNRHGFMRLEPVDPGLLRAMLDAVFCRTEAAGDQGRPARLGRGRTLGRDWLMAHRSRTTPVVVDPVLRPRRRLGGRAKASSPALRESVLLAADYATPNLPESRAGSVPDSDARRLLALGPVRRRRQGRARGWGNVPRHARDGAGGGPSRRADGSRGKVHGTGCASPRRSRRRSRPGSPRPRPCSWPIAFVPAPASLRRAIRGRPAGAARDRGTRLTGADACPRTGGPLILHHRLRLPAPPRWPNTPGRNAALDARRGSPARERTSGRSRSMQALRRGDSVGQGAPGVVPRSEARCSARGLRGALRRRLFRALGHAPPPPRGRTVVCLDGRAARRTAAGAHAPHCGSASRPGASAWRTGQHPRT